MSELPDRQLQILRVLFKASAPLSDADIAEGCGFERWEDYRVTYGVSLLHDAGLLVEVDQAPRAFPPRVFEITEAGRAVVLNDRIMR